MKRNVDELTRLEVAVRTRMGLLNLWLGTQPPRVRRLVMRIFAALVLRQGSFFR